MIDAKKMPVVGTNRMFHSMMAEQQQDRRYAELNSPSTQDLLRRERLHQSTLDTRQTAVQSNPTPSHAPVPVPTSTPVPAEYTIRKEETDRKKHTGNVKTKEKLEEEETVVEVKLPAAVLVVENLPKIDIAIPPPPTALTVSRQLLIPVTPTGSKFVFSQPTIVTSVVTPVPISTFKFSEPLGGIMSCSTICAPGGDKRIVSSASLKPRISTDEVSGNFIGQNEEDKKKNTFIVDIQTVSVQKTPSTGPTAVRSNNSSPDCKYNLGSVADNKTVSTTKKWGCSKCKKNSSSSLETCISWQKNENSETHDTIKNNIKSSVSSGFDNLYKKPIGTWECSTCLIQNKSEATMCIACETSKPVAKEKTVKKDSINNKKPSSITQASSETEQSGSSFGNLFKKPSGSWTCDVCMINNDADKVKCAACETLKLGATSPKATETSGPKFSFGIPLAVSASSSGVGATYSFGIPKGGQTSSTFNTSFSVPKSASSDSAQTPTPTFSFGIPKPVTTENNSSNVVTSRTSPKGTFQFVSDPVQANAKESNPPSASVPVTSNIFGNLSKKSTPETSKLAETKKPTFRISAPTLSASIKYATPVFGVNSEKSSPELEKTGNTPTLFAFGSSKVTQNEVKTSPVSSSSSKPAQPAFIIDAEQKWFGSNLSSGSGVKEKTIKKDSINDKKPGALTQASSETEQSGSFVGNLFKKPSGSWTCDVCMINNNADKVKCAACETPKPGATIPKAAESAGPSSETKQSRSRFGHLCRKPSNSWTCAVCMINNNADKVKCAACETPKPRATIPNITESTELSSVTKQSGSGFVSLFEKHSGSWICDVCMINNNADKVKCAACETPKPGETVPMATESAGPSSESEQYRSRLVHLFKKLFGSWTCDVCMSINYADKVKCADCKTPKPSTTIPKATESAELSSETKQSASGFGNIFKKPPGSWTCVVCMSINYADKVKCAACETPKPGATIPKAAESALPSSETKQSLRGFGNLFKKPSGSGISPFNASASAPRVFGAPTPKQALAFGEQATPAPLFFDSQSAQQPQTPANPMFEFGSNQQQSAAVAPAPTPTFMFGSTPAAPALANPSTFDPNIKPSFNFTQGAATPVFSAIPTLNPAGPAQPWYRKIRKAVRRTNISSVRN